MKALFITINHEEHFRKLLKEFGKTGIRGGTILSSEGLAASQFFQIKRHSVTECLFVFYPNFSKS